MNGYHVMDYLFVKPYHCDGLSLNYEYTIKDLPHGPQPKING
jgi:hypothetical protein